VDEVGADEACASGDEEGSTASGKVVWHGGPPLPPFSAKVRSTLDLGLDCGLFCGLLNKKARRGRAASPTDSIVTRVSRGESAFVAGVLNFCRSWRLS
jgi:hypothetical protein